MRVFCNQDHLRESKMLNCSHLKIEIVPHGWEYLTLCLCRLDVKNWLQFPREVTVEMLLLGLELN
jgi:hypothetical protein